MLQQPGWIQERLSAMQFCVRCSYEIEVALENFSEP